jgi:hypothetical protein
MRYFELDLQDTNYRGIESYKVLVCANTALEAIKKITEENEKKGIKRDVIAVRITNYALVIN